MDNMTVSTPEINASTNIFADNCDHYWDAGLPVIPLRDYSSNGGKDGKPTGKEPAIPKWEEMQSRMPNKGERWAWKLQHGTGNIGLPLGPQSRLIAVDLDTDDPVAVAVLNRILPRSPWHRVGLKGSVRIYRWSDLPTFRIKYKDADGNVRTLVEVLAAGAQVVLPPSIHPNTGKPYRANHDLVDCLDDLETLPDDIEERMRDGFIEAGFVLCSEGNGTTSATTGGRIGEGARNTTLYREGAKLAGMGLGVEAITEHLLDVNRTQCVPPLDEDEVRTIARSAAGYKVNASYELNDVGNAERFVRDHADRVRYVSDRGIWRFYTGTHWADDPGELNMIRLACETVEGIKDDADAQTKVEVRKAMKVWARKSGNRRELRGMIDVAATMPGMSARSTDFDQLPGKLVVANGVIDLFTGDLSPHDPALLNTRCIPIPYNPDAKAPRFDAAMARVQPNPVVRDFQRTFIGQAMHGTRPEQIMVWLHGRGGRNGKSFLADLLLLTLPGYVIETSAAAFLSDDKRNPNQPRSDLMRLQGSRLVCGQETDDSRRLDGPRLKQLTGDATYTARANHKDEGEIPITFSLMVLTNPWPNANEADDALWSRFVRVPYDVVIPREERIPNLYKVIHEAEAAGVLAWVVRGAVEYAQKGLPIPEVLIEATAAWRRRISTVEPFMQTYTQRAAGAAMQLAFLQSEYVKFVQRAYGNPLGREHFRTRLEQLGYLVEDTEHGAQVRNVQLAPLATRLGAQGSPVAA